MPVYCTYKALECKTTNEEDEGEKNHWLTYWAGTLKAESKIVNLHMRLLVDSGLQGPFASHIG